MEAQPISVSVVIPVYRSAACLPELVAQLTRTLDQRGENYELVFVDDASPDNSWEVIRSLAQKTPRLRAVRLMRNYGQHRATLYGLALARGAVVATMDDDLQHPPDQLPLLLDALAGHPDLDCVFGCAAEKHHARYRNWGSNLIRHLNARTFDLPHEVRSSSFRVLRQPVARALAECRTCNPALATMIYQITRQVRSIPVRHEARRTGSSNYTFYKQVRLALDYVCGTSLLPLHLVGVLGFTFCLFSMGYVAVILHRYFRDDIQLVGWTSTIILLSFSAGVILLALAIIGEYLVRILREVQGLPACMERERTGWRPPAAADH